MATLGSRPKAPRCHISNGSKRKDGSATTIRGAYVPARRALFLYRGLGFFYDDELIDEVGRRAGALMAALGLQPDVDVHVGPVDAVVRGVRYAQRRVGTLGSLTANS